MEEKSDVPANNSTALVKILNQINVPTLLAIFLFGGGNIFQGQQISKESHDDVERAVREIHQLFNKIEEFEQRQIQILKNQTDLLHSANDSLKNQEEMLTLIRKTQKRVLKDTGIDEDKPPSF
jgi:pyoverdine/dityrosine biosynthesis protein Dit1